jgi:hypothetical protein
MVTADDEALRASLPRASELMAVERTEGTFAAVVPLLEDLVKRDFGLA